MTEREKDRIAGLVLAVCEEVARRVGAPCAPATHEPCDLFVHPKYRHFVQRRSA